MKNPPPFVPSILIASCEAKGPCSITWLVPSSVVAVTRSFEVLDASLRDQEQSGDDCRSEAEHRACTGHVHPEISDGLCRVARKSTNQSNRNRNSDGGGNEILDSERGHLDEIAKRRVGRVRLPVGVGHEADRRVVSQIGRHRRGKRRSLGRRKLHGVEGQMALQALEQIHRQKAEDA